MINYVEKLTSIQGIVGEELKEKKMKEQTQAFFFDKTTNKSKSHEVSNPKKGDQIEYKKKDRTKRFIRMQRKYSGSHLLDNKKNNEKK